MKKYLITGLLVWVPIVISVWVLLLLAGLLDNVFLLLPERYQPKTWMPVNVPGLGLLPILIIVFFTGMVAANLAGKKLLDLWHGLLNRIPIFRSIYGGVKQISDTLFSPEGKAFRKAVLVRYPHAGTWTVALLTGEPQNEVTDHLGHDNVAVFVPTTPNITAGFFLIVPNADVIELQMSVDEALKYIISMGVAEPARPIHRNGAEMKKSGTDPNPKPLG
ncbi:MAG: DUF502 domain-containing protein [Betaproteobacteria bacterium]|nr:DUF502 domain-containing protein [Betaproteobacteria bacterium]